MSVHVLEGGEAEPEPGRTGAAARREARGGRLSTACESRGLFASHVYQTLLSKRGLSPRNSSPAKPRAGVRVAGERVSLPGAGELIVFATHIVLFLTEFLLPLLSAFPHGDGEKPPRQEDTGRWVGRGPRGRRARFRSARNSLPFRAKRRLLVRVLSEQRLPLRRKVPRTDSAP